MITDAEDTSGFYRLDGPNQLSWGQNLVSGDGFDLFRSMHETYSYPIGGWYWFNSLAEARAFFGLNDNTTNESQ